MATARSASAASAGCAWAGEAVPPRGFAAAWNWITDRVVGAEASQRQWSMNWVDDDGRRIEVRVKGRVWPNEDGTDIASLEDGGFVTIEVQEGGRRDVLEVRARANGALERLFKRDRALAALARAGGSGDIS